MNDNAQRNRSSGPERPEDWPGAGRWVGRRLAAWWFGWLLAGALYLLLIDTTDLPELIVGAVAAAIAATGFELAREHT